MRNIRTTEKLLKDELAATETYRQALAKLREDVVLGESEYLAPIYGDHKDAVASLQAEIAQLGGGPYEDSWGWGTWAEIVEGGANLLGQKAILRVLLEGEKIGVEDYDEALQDPDLPLEVRSLIETKLLPAQHAHIRTLDRLLDVASA